MRVSAKGFWGKGSGARVEARVGLTNKQVNREESDMLLSLVTCSYDSKVKKKLFD